jgi:hypothetical protein
MEEDQRCRTHVTDGGDGATCRILAGTSEVMDHLIDAAIARGHYPYGS